MTRTGRHIVVQLAVVWLISSTAWTAPAEDFQLSVGWQVIANHGEQFDAELTLSNAGPIDLPATGWRIYFNSARLLTIDYPNAALALRHVNGDFFELRPTAQFQPLKAGTSRQFSLNGAYWAIKETDAPAGFYLVNIDRHGQEKGKPRPLPLRIAPFLKPRQISRSPADKLPIPTAESRFASNPPLAPARLSARDMVVPTPRNAESLGASVQLDSATIVAYSPSLEVAASLLVEHLRRDVGIHATMQQGPQSGRNVIQLRLTAGNDNGSFRKSVGEGYTLKVDVSDGIEITAEATAGVFYGTQSLLALLPIDSYRHRTGVVSVGCVVIEDAPRFSYRGLHLDVARNFHSAESVKKLLDVMAFYKLNRLHLHLTDDEGWRLDIKAFPELTSIGGRRGHTLNETDHLQPSLGSGPSSEEQRSSGSGYYTQEDFVEILRYAHQRHIEVVPELDFPGHARAAIKSLQVREAMLRRSGAETAAKNIQLVDPLDTSKYQSVQLWRDNVVDVGLESSYSVLKTIIDEVVGLYGRAGVPLTVVHIGGDEVPEGAWQASPACKELVRTGAVGDLKRKTLHSYFVNRIVEMLAKHKLRAGCWEECLLLDEQVDGKTAKRPNPELLSAKPIAYVWNNVWGWGNEEAAYRLANVGYDVVLCNATNLYFDLAYDKDPSEPGYYWAGFVDERNAFDFNPLDFYINAHTDALGNRIAPEVYLGSVRLTDAGKGHILGIQGQLWSETLTSPDRLEYAAFPKVIALAERAWAADPTWATISDAAQRHTAMEKDWQNFANRLGQRELPRLDFLAGGVRYRVPPPGATILAGKLHANVAYPGLAIRYTLDGSDPITASPRYDLPLAPTGTVKLKAFSPAGRPSRTVTVERP